MRVVAALILAVILLVGISGCGAGGGQGKTGEVSGHFDGKVYFNPGVEAVGEPRRGGRGWLWRWVFRTDMPEWPETVDVPVGPPPVVRAPSGTIRVTPVGHATFLIQMNGLNILTDPIWSDRASPVSWAGPKRHKKPGISFEDLPPVDVVLLSHNHYDHLDLPTLRRLARKGVPRAVVTLGNLDLVEGTGIARVDELDWWQSVRVSPDVTVTVVPAVHFSSRTLWDRNRTLWGGFVVSGPGGNLFYSGDTGYGPHFREIARRFAPVRVALLPIAPFRPPGQTDSLPRFSMHMGPAEAVRAHMDLGAEMSIAAHYQVFQLGWDRFDDARDGLIRALAEQNLQRDAFVALDPGQARELTVRATRRAMTGACIEESGTVGQRRQGDGPEARLIQTGSLLP